MQIHEYKFICLIEELLETAHAICKALRFTLFDKHPTKLKSNIEQLQLEVNDVYAWLDIIQEEYPADIFRDEYLIKVKKEKIEKYLHYSKEVGVIDDTSN